MKSKKKDEKIDSKLTPHLQKLENVLSSQGNLGQPIEENKRLNAFTQVYNPSTCSKKIEEKVISRISDQKALSKTRDSKVTNPEENKLASLTKEKKPRHFFPSNHTKSPIIGKQTSKLTPDNIMSYSVDKSDFAIIDDFKGHQVHHSFDPYFNTIQVSNEAYHPGHGEGYESNCQDVWSQNHFNTMNTGFDTRQNYNMNQSMNYGRPGIMQPMTTMNFYNNQSHRPSHSFFNSPNRESMHQNNLENTKRDGDFGGNQTNTERNRGINANQQWISKMNRDYNIPSPNISFKKGDSSVQKFRRKNLLRTKSRVIKISGVNKGMTGDLHSQLQKIGDVVELQMKWLSQGDMQVKFKDEKSAREAMMFLDGMEMNGSKLQVTQVFQIVHPFAGKLRRVFPQTKLGLIKESEDSDDQEKISLDEDKSPLK